MSPPAAAKPVVELFEVEKTFDLGAVAVHALRGVTLTVAEAEFVAIMGSSGSGKTTLMNIVGCLDAPTAGRYLLDGVEVEALDDWDLAEIRNRKIGFVFQTFNLVPRTSAQENVELPLLYAGVDRKTRRRYAIRALERVGLGDRLDHHPNELSGGQQQRVAVARGLVTNPALLLADEPSGNLDSQSTAEILDIFEEVNAEGRTVVLITHEDDVAARARRIVRLRDGEVVGDTTLAPGVVGA